jgi:hypothetical protein
VAVQLTPREFGQVVWRGGAPPKSDGVGGWGYNCKFCIEGSRLHPAKSRGAADRALFNHVLARHRHEQVVKDLLKDNDRRHPNGAAELGGRS